MNILVFVKQVPETLDVKLDPKTGRLMRDGVAGIINPYDNNAIEAALSLREIHGGTVTAVSMGPPDAARTLNQALAMGCDKAVLLSSRAFGGADTLATGYVLSVAARQIGSYDLLLFGRLAVDADTAQTGPIVAEFLDLPQITLAHEIDVKDGWVYCSREHEGSIQKVRAKLPAVVTVCSELNEPRYPTIPGIMALREDQLSVWTENDIAGLDPMQIGVPGSPSIVSGIFPARSSNIETKLMSDDIVAMASAIADALSEAQLI